MIYQRIEGLNRKDQHVALADLQYNDASATGFCPNTICSPFIT